MKTLAKITISFLLVGFNLVSYSQTLDDWKSSLKAANENKQNADTKGYSGRESIPYDDIRRNAKEEHSSLKTMQAVRNSCNPSEVGTKDLRYRIDRLKSKISNESDESKKNELQESLKEKRRTARGQV